MKKLITTFCAFALSFNLASAQDYTPKSGDWGISSEASEIFTYFGNMFTSSENIPTLDYTNDYGFHGKYFTDDMTAWRAGINLGISSISDTMDNFTSSFDLSFQVGKEYRKGSSRLQGIYGYVAAINLSNSSVEIDGDIQSEGSEFSFGARGFIGVEYFFKPKMSLGAEYYHGLDYKTDDVNTRFSVNGGTTAINLNFYF